MPSCFSGFAPLVCDEDQFLRLLLVAAAKSWRYGVLVCALAKIGEARM
jgi:hypothetical protein